MPNHFSHCFFSHNPSKTTNPFLLTKTPLLIHVKRFPLPKPHKLTSRIRSPEIYFLTPNPDVKFRLAFPSKKSYRSQTSKHILDTNQILLLNNIPNFKFSIVQTWNRARSTSHHFPSKGPRQISYSLYASFKNLQPTLITCHSQHTARGELDSDCSV